MNSNRISILAMFILLCFFMILSSCNSNENLAPEQVDPDELVESDPEPKPEKATDEPEPEVLEPIENTVEIEQWQTMRLIIPAIDVDLICVGDGDVFDRELLEQGPTHFQMSDLPSNEKGNVAFAGMWMFFSDIDDLVGGDEIYLDVAEYRFIYEVVWKEVVDKYDWEAIDSTDYPSITLQTSYPIDFSEPNPDYRLIIRGELSEVVKISSY